MAAAFRAQAASNTGSSTANSLAVTMPTLVAGDALFVAVAVSGGTGATITAPSGWTQVNLNSQSTNVKLGIYWRLATGQEPASYTFNVDTLRMISATATSWSGASQRIPVGVNSGNAAATTTATISTEAIPYTGIPVRFFASHNTTGTSTISGSYTNRSDTSTSATPFVESATMQAAGASTFPLGTTADGTSQTFSQTVNYCECSVFLEDARPTVTSLQEVQYAGGSFTAALSSSISPSTNKFSTYDPNTLILAFVEIRNGSTTVSSITGGGLSWALAVRANAVGGSCEVWWAVAATPITAQTFTINYSASTTTGVYQIISLTGAHPTSPIGATATAAPVTQAPTVSLTTTVNGSWVYGAGNDPSASTSATAGSGQTILRSSGDATNGASGWSQRRTAYTPLSGTSVTISDTAPSANTCNILAVEIVPCAPPKTAYFISQHTAQVSSF